MLLTPSARPLPSAWPAPHQGSLSRRRLVVAAILLGLGVLALLLLVVPGSIQEQDGQSMLQVTRSIVEHGDATVSVPRYGQPVGVPGLDGHLYSKYGPGQSLAAVPLYLAGRGLEPLVPAHYRPELPILAASLLPALVTALTVMLLALAAVELGATARGALALGLVYALATPAIVYGVQWFSEPLTACAVLAAVYALLRDRSSPSPWRPLLAGAALAVAVATRLETILFAPPLLLYILARRDGRASRALSLLLPLGVALIGLGLYNLARFGSPLETGYSKGDLYAYRDTHPWHGPLSLLDGLYGLLLSPGKGLVEYAPVALLAPFGVALAWARRRAEMALLLALFLIDLIAHANVLIRWVGGWSWGPRFLIPVLPLVLLLLAPLLGPAVRYAAGARGALAMVALLGLLVQAPALAIHEPHIYIYDLRPRYCYHTMHCPQSALERLELDYIARPQLSPIVGSWQLLFDHRTWTPERLVEPLRVARRSVTVAPHTWWRLLALQGVPAAALVVVCALLAVLALVLLSTALRLARPVLPAATQPHTQH